MTELEFDVMERTLRKTYGDFYRVNKYLIKHYGLEIATFFEILVSHHQYLLTRDLIKREDGFFYVDSKRIEELSSLYYKQQLQMMTMLEKEFGLITSCVEGIPPRKYIKIDYQRYADLIDEEKGIFIENRLCRVEKNKRGLIKRVGKAKVDFEQSDSIS